MLSYDMTLLSALHKLLIHPCRAPLRSVLVLAPPYPLYEGLGKGTERLRNMPKDAQQRPGRAGFRLGQAGPESMCLTPRITDCLLAWKEQQHLRGCRTVTMRCDRRAPGWGWGCLLLG